VSQRTLICVERTSYSRDNGAYLESTCQYAWHLIEAEMAALRQKIDRQQTTIERVKADKRYPGRARADFRGAKESVTLALRVSSLEALPRWSSFRQDDHCECLKRWFPFAQTFCTYEV
jgi:hypothetical protein